MSELRQRFPQDLKTAMKAKEPIRVSTLRLILATLKDRDIATRGDGGGDGISDDEILEMLAKMVRQRRESIELYEKSGRDDLAQQEAQEITVIEEYLPKPLSPEETEAVVRQVVDEVCAGSLRDMGKVMGTLKERYAGRLDFARAGALVKAALTDNG